MIKTFPKSRICVIDCYPSFEQGLQKAYIFAKKHNVSLNTADGKKLILSYCLKTIKQDYNSTTSPYPKVLCVSQKAITKKVQNFIDSHFDSMMNYLPLPYCGKFDLSSPDLESAAENCLKQQKPQRKFNDFTSRLKLKPTT
jgi:hypothetical protein